MSDDPVSPVERVEPAPRAVPAPRATPATAAGAAAAPGGSRAPVGLDPALVHEQIEHPVRSPGAVDGRATVHDAALHGDRLARAIDERAQHLAGAAASAGSGQAAVVALEGVEPDDDPARDPLARVDPVDEDPDRRDPRNKEQQADDDLGA